MKTYRITLTLLAAFVALLLSHTAAAQVQSEWSFSSIVSTSECGVSGEGATVSLERVNISGMGIFYWDTVATSGGRVLMDEYFQADYFTDGLHEWGIYDADDRGNQTGSFDDLQPGANVKVTITLWGPGDGGPQVLDTDSFSFQCGGETVGVPTLGNSGLFILLTLLSIVGIMSLGRHTNSI